MNWSNIYCIIYYVARLQISQEETYKFERNWANNWSLCIIHITSAHPEVRKKVESTDILVYRYQEDSNKFRITLFFFFVYKGKTYKIFKEKLW